MKKTEVVTKRIVYEGKCPECSAVQTGRIAEHVDILCFTCRRAQAKLSDSMMLAGAVIESAEYMNDDIYKLVIVSPDGTRGTIQTMYDSSALDYYLAEDIL